VKTVLLAGGLGTRLREETEFKPKPMVAIGGKPILWHIMKSYAAYGHEDFVVCTGYRGEIIKEYFLNYEARNNDFTITLGESGKIHYHDAHGESSWRVTVADTGAATMTGGRVKLVQKYIGNNRFMCTYGDGVSDVDVGRLISFHDSHGKLATMTAVEMPSRFGVVEMDFDGTVTEFREKPRVEGLVNVGFFVFEPEVFDYLDSNSVLEQDPFRQLAADGQLRAYRHEGFWQPMDTFREATILNDLWNAGEAPWKVW